MSQSRPEKPTPLPGQEKPGLLGRLRVPLSLPLATIALVAAIVALILVLGRPFSGANGTPDATPTPTQPPAATEVPPPTPTPTLEPGVSRIVIARFVDGGSDFEAAQTIEGSLLAALASDSLTGDVQVLRVEDEVTSHEEARALLEREEAALVIWGRVEAASIDAQTTLAGDGAPDLQRVHADPPAPQSVMFPLDMQFILSRDLGADVTFLSLVTIGQLDLAGGDTGAARTHFQSALLAMPAALPREARDRGVGIVNFYYGLIDLLDGDALSALQDDSQAVRLYGDLASAYNNRGVAYFALGDYERALSDFEATLATDSGDTRVLGNRTLTLFALGDTDQALLDAERLLELAPDEARSVNLRGLVRYGVGDYEAALEDFQQAVTLAPESASASFNVAATLDALGRSDEAVETYDSLLDTHPGDALALVYRGDAYLHQGLEAEAVTDYDEALKLDLDLLYGYQQRARFYVERGNYSVALVDLETALKLDGENLQTYDLLGQLYTGQADFEAAGEAFDSALAIDPDHVQALVGRGTVRRIQRIFINARDELERALELGGPTPALQYNLGLVYYQLGQYAEAVDAFSYVVEQSPDDAAAQAGLSLALDARASVDEADEALRTALALDPRLADPDYVGDELYWSRAALDRLAAILDRLEEN